jgi:hypothetical protein
MSFDSVSGGLVDSVVAGLGNDSSFQLANVLSGQSASFSVNSILAGAVTSASGYGLNQGENYLLNQISSLVPPSLNNGLTNAVVTQVASVGIQAASGFIQQGVQNLLGLNQAPNVTTAGLAQQSSRSTISIPDSVVQSLPEMAGSSYTLEDIVFTLVPANAGAQTAPQVQSKPTVDLGTAFNPDVNLSTPGIDKLKSSFATTFPATGSSVNTAAAFSPGKNLGVSPLANTKAYW